MAGDGVPKPKKAGDRLVDAPLALRRAELHFRPITEAAGWPGKQNRSQALPPRS